MATPEHLRQGSRLTDGDRGRIAAYADDAAATLRKYAAEIRRVAEGAQPVDGPEPGTRVRTSDYQTASNIANQMDSDAKILELAVWKWR